jgi:hypothetical protein
VTTGSIGTTGTTASTGTTDRFATARAVADAVLYEGYVLYPYRASSRKNQLRWQFGVLTPRAFSEADGSERWSMRTEALVDPGAAPKLSVRVRCLQVQHRAVEAPVGGTGEFAPVDKLEVDGEVYVDWDEALDQTVDLEPTGLFGRDSAPDGHPEKDGRQYREVFTFAGGTDTELVRSAGGSVAGRIVRRRQTIQGRVGVAASRVAGALVKVTVTVENLTDWAGTSTRRDEVIGRSLVAVHTMLAVDDGVFVSLLDPPDSALQAVGDCHSDGTFPVLIGGDDIVLSSPIILYDHPEVAPESPGDLYDATEIDEILALRVLTLTDEEKLEARATDPRSAAIIDRCDDMPPEIWDRLHGTFRSLRPAPERGTDPGPAAPAPEKSPEVPWWDPAADASVDPWSDSVIVGGVEIAKGSPVRLQPSRRSDAQDLFLHGLAATVAGVFTDVDGGTQVAVTIDDDPATVELSWQGRYLFFHPDEVEPLPVRPGAP